MPALRTFSLLNKSAAQSVYAYPCNLVDFDGNLNTGAAGSFLQFHDKATAATTGNVPVKSFYISAAGPTPLASIFQALGPVPFANGLSIGISSTEATYTAQTATFDIFGEIEEGTQSTDSISGLTTVTTSSDQVLQIYTAGAIKTVYSLAITNGEGVKVWPMLFSNRTAATDGNHPDVATLMNPATSDGSIANGSSATFYFGGGLLVHSTTGGSTATLECHLSTTATVYTGSSGLASTLTAKVK